MTNAIGVVMTEHIVAGRLEDHKLVGDSVRFPADAKEVDALQALPSGELVEILASQVVELAGKGGKVDAIGIAVPGVVRHNIVEDSPNLNQIKGMHLARNWDRCWPSEESRRRFTLPMTPTRLPRAWRPPAAN